MQIIAILVLVLMLFCTFVVYACMVAGARSDEQSAQAFAQWQREKQANEEHRQEQTGQKTGPTDQQQK